MPHRHTSPDIAMFLPSLEGGGAERVMLNLLEGLCARGLAVDLVLAQLEGELMDQVPPGVRLIRLSPLHLPLGRTFAALPMLSRYLRQARPTAILTVSDRANIVGILARRLAGSATRVVATVHRQFSCEPQGIRRPYLKGIRWLARRTYSAADAIVAVSQGAARDAATRIDLPEDRMAVIYNPVLTPSLLDKAKQTAEHRWFRETIPVIVSVGRLEPPKDFSTLIHAFALIRKKRPSRLLILGEGPLRHDLQQLTRRLGVESDVEMPGFVSNPYSPMLQAAAVVLSSTSEALPTVLIEALYLGRPVIATDCPSGPREILRDGAFGSLVPVGDAVTLAHAMETTLAREPAVPDPASWRPFTLDAATSRYIEVLLGGGNSPGPEWTRRRPLVTA